jgi:hypothetical protein
MALPGSQGRFRAGVVLDNLIHSGEMSAVIGVFVDPGAPDNCTVEYDPCDDVYARFLLSEILPNVTRRYRISEDPDQRAVAGGSAGGYCAFAAAWHRPDTFRRVLSFTGGGLDPALIASTERNATRVHASAQRDINWNAPADNMLADDPRIAAAPSRRRATTSVSCSVTATTAPSRETTALRSCPTPFVGCDGTMNDLPKSLEANNGIEPPAAAARSRSR